MRAAHQGVPVAVLPSAPRGGLMFGLFGNGAPAPVETDSSGSVPPAPIPSAGNTTSGGGGLDGWLLHNLFSRR